ncbi:hypothetical protein [Burkholderia vietnamiensis]|uniref:hypothetical protein n=1 Tax=Burkholderia vietnamiensis TaxID=60552 RepID=UPI001B946B09|nr:hypothetical protein [Burkholderia vietnamiensis]MBR8030782.1 hypothetical protein [Burkholderia vietnamiensis]
MFRIDDATASPSLPAPEAAGSEGYFTEGNPATGTPATKVRGSWLNMLQEELCAILAAAGIARSKTTYNQVNSALQKMYSPVVGAQRNLSMSVAAASASATLTADQIVVTTALNGQTFILPSFSKTINLATTGAGGMDTGSAPASGYVALYAIYNPTTGASALLAKNATSAVQPNVYGGANMPAGYTASALVSVWPTNGSGQFVVAYQVDRSISIANNVVFTNSTTTSGYVSVSIAGAVPPNAKTFSGGLQANTSVAAALQFGVAATSAPVGIIGMIFNSAGNQSSSIPFVKVPLSTPQTTYYNATNSTGTPTFTLIVSSYEF